MSEEVAGGMEAASSGRKPSDVFGHSPVRCQLPIPALRRCYINQKLLAHSPFVATLQRNPGHDISGIFFLEKAGEAGK